MPPGPGPILNQSPPSFPRPPASSTSTLPASALPGRELLLCDIRQIRRPFARALTQWPTKALLVTTKCWRSLAVRTPPPSFPPPMLVANLLRLTTGGSFGVVYKAIEKATGEVVAVKHVGHAPPPPQLDLS